MRCWFPTGTVCILSFHKAVIKWVDRLWWTIFHCAITFSLRFPGVHLVLVPWMVQCALNNRKYVTCLHQTQLFKTFKLHHRKKKDSTQCYQKLLELNQEDSPMTSKCSTYTEVLLAAKTGLVIPLILSLQWQKNV